jgi:hypothetical protein
MSTYNLPLLLHFYDYSGNGGTEKQLAAAALVYEDTP